MISPGPAAAAAGRRMGGSGYPCANDGSLSARIRLAAAGRFGIDPLALAGPGGGGRGSAHGW
jgi:hypothetical protein